MNPFPGLRPFEYDESHLYFGRDGQNTEILRKLRSRFVAVVGLSSSGKSSLVRASLLPALAGGMMGGGATRWLTALLRPGGNPIENLARALVDAFRSKDSDGNADDLLRIALARATLTRSSHGIVEFVRQERMAPDEKLIIVVDQFEELFRYISLQEGGEDEAAAFVRLLLTAIKQSDFPIYVLLTLRSDFLGSCTRFWGLSEALNESLYLVPRMRRDQCREAILGPIAVAGGVITQPLLNRLLNDVGDNPDYLPLLQHALERTWSQWVAKESGRPMRLEHYEAIGTMSEALGRHADEAFAELSDPDKRLAEVLFKTLTERGTDNREYRRPTLLREICEIAGVETNEMIRVIDAFRSPERAFLMPPVHVLLTPETVIDISHESLIRNWPRLKRWVAEEARSAQIYVRIAETAMLYEEEKAGLWRDPDLQLALNWRREVNPNQAWARRYHPKFETAMRFLDRSLEAHRAEQVEKERHRVRTLRRAVAAIALLCVLTATSLVLATSSWRLRKQSEQRRLEAEKLTKLMEKQKLAAEQERADAVRTAERETIQRLKAEQETNIAKFEVERTRHRRSQRTNR